MLLSNKNNLTLTIQKIFLAMLGLFSGYSLWDNFGVLPYDWIDAPPVSMLEMMHRSILLPVFTFIGVFTNLIVFSKFRKDSLLWFIMSSNIGINVLLIFSAISYFLTYDTSDLSLPEQLIVFVFFSLFVNCTISFVSLITYPVCRFFGKVLSGGSVLE